MTFSLKSTHGKAIELLLLRFIFRTSNHIVVCFATKFNSINKLDRIIENMQRRNLHQQQQQHQRAILPTSKPKAAGSLNGSTTNNTNHRSNAESSDLFRTWVLVLIIIVLTFIISFFPEQRRMMYDTEQEMEKVVYEAERDIMEYWLSSKRVYSADSISSDSTMHQADVRMQQQSSKWVDSEKKLKKALQVLVERQEKGLDLGVPVLTRYLGDSIPAFYSKDDASFNMGINTVEEWNAVIEEKYAEMRNEENRWREFVTSTLLSDRG